MRLLRRPTHAAGVSRHFECSAAHARPEHPSPGACAALPRRVGDGLPELLKRPPSSSHRRSRRFSRAVHSPTGIFATTLGPKNALQGILAANKVIADITAVKQVRRRTR
jgi:hypothetical protein